MINIDAMPAETAEVSITQEELLNLIDKGIRPEWLPYQSFKELRSRIQKEKKNKLKGTFIHISSIRNIKSEEKIIGITYNKTLDKK